MGDVFLAFVLLLVLIVGLRGAKQRSDLLAARVADLERESHMQGLALARLKKELLARPEAPSSSGAQLQLAQAAPAVTEAPPSLQLAAPYVPAFTAPAAEPAEAGVEAAGEPAAHATGAVTDADAAVSTDATAAAVTNTAPALASLEPPLSAPGAAAEAARASALESLAVPAIDWERWVGVRGAAVVGAVVLAFAAVLFLRYAVENGLIPPALRVALGTLLGVGCLVFAEKLRERYVVTANALSGGGLVILYAAFWAARILYDLIGMQVAFGLMALTTAAGCLLAVRYASLVIAVLGLVGGFATPLLLSSGQDNPIGLFGYILLLDLGFVLVARKRGWDGLMSLALAGTLLMEAGWIGLRMGPDRLLLGIGVVALFAALFVWAARKPSAESATWFQNQVAAVLLPFCFAFYFATQATLGAQLVPIALLLGLLTFGAGWVSRRVPDASWLPLSSAVASVTVVGVWLWSAPATSAACWQGALCSAGLGLVFQLRAELSAGEREASRAAALAQLGFLVLLVLTPLGGFGPPQIAPWLIGWLLLAGLASANARFPQLSGLSLAVALLLALGLAGFQSERAWPQAASELSVYFGIEVAIATALLALSLLRGVRTDHAAAALFPAALLLGQVVLPRLFTAPEHGILLGASWILGALTLFGATRLADGRALALGAVAFLFAQNVALFALTPDAAGADLVLAFTTASLLLVVAWPLLVQSRVQHPRWAFYTSALAGPLWFLGLRHLYVLCFGSTSIGVLPLLLAALSLGILWTARRSQSLAPDVLRSALAWHAAVALGFVSLAIPLQLDRQWITIGWALESAAVLVLFRRLDHAGLKWFGLCLALAVSVRLVLNPSVLEYADRGAWPFLNWLLYTYWVPALALLAGQRALRDLELERLRPWERQLYPSQPAGANGLALGAILIVFVWINLSIMDAFGEGTRLVVDFARRPTRDLVLSLAWAAYAGVLLTLGMVKRVRGPRWLSLALLILTIGKVFLYDLGQLQDLYQVLSLLGLAFSLIAVSLAYQRFVFGKKAPAADV